MKNCRNKKNIKQDKKISCCWAVVFTLRDSMDCGTPCFSILHHPVELAQAQIHLVCDVIQPCHSLSSNRLILCHPLLLLPSIFSSIRVYSNESALPIRWSKYWSFTFSIIPYSDYSVMISCRTDWLDLAASSRETQG